MGKLGFWTEEARVSLISGASCVYESAFFRFIEPNLRLGVQLLVHCFFKITLVNFDDLSGAVSRSQEQICGLWTRCTYSFVNILINHGRFDDPQFFLGLSPPPRLVMHVFHMSSVMVAGLIQSSLILRLPHHAGASSALRTHFCYNFW